MSRHTPHAAHHILYVTHHTLHVTRHTSHATRHTQHVTRRTPLCVGPSDLRTWAGVARTGVRLMYVLSPGDETDRPRETGPGAAGAGRPLRPGRWTTCGRRGPGADAAVRENHSSLNRNRAGPHCAMSAQSRTRTMTFTVMDSKLHGHLKRNCVNMREKLKRGIPLNPPP